MVEDWNRYGATVEQWNSGTVIVEQWNNYGGTVNRDGGPVEQ